jgi:hypothetical protein
MYRVPWIGTCVEADYYFRNIARLIMKNNEKNEASAL